MNIQDKIPIGIRNIENANYLQDKLLPTIVNAKKWELVAYQSHLNAELILVGVVTLLGGDAKPKDGKHHLEALLQKLENCFDENNTNIVPYIILNVSTNSGFVLEYLRGNIVLWKKIGNSYTELGYATGIDAALGEHEGLDLEYDPTNSAVTVMVHDKRILGSTDSSFSDAPATKIRRCFSLKNDINIIKKLKSLSQKLLTHDKFISARYSLEKITENQALEIKTLSDEVFALANRIIRFYET